MAYDLLHYQFRVVGINSCYHTQNGVWNVYCRMYEDYILEAAILTVLGQEVCLQKGEAQEVKSMIELGTRISHGEHPFSLFTTFLPVEIFIGCEYACDTIK